MSLVEGLEHCVRPAEPMARHTWLRLGGPAEYFAEPTCEEELVELVRRCRQTNTPIRILGAGSNVLVRDAGVAGLVVRLTTPAFCQLAVHGRRIRAGGGVQLAHLISAAVREGLSGLEQLAGIPGTVGGAVRGNAGTQSGDIGQWTRSATVLTRAGERCVRRGDELRFAYRSSSLDELAILDAEFELEQDDPAALTKRMQKIWIVRKAKHPMGPQGFGWIFKNPVGLEAGELIEQAGLKGAQVGRAEVSDRHANVIVAHPGATSQDVIRLIELMESRVAERLGVELERDIEIW